MTNAQSLVKELRAKDHLPALDGSVEAICALTDDPLTCIADLTAVILRDCSLTSNLITTANSALYGTAEPIKTISAAITSLGFEMIRSLSIGLGLVKQISECARNRNLYRLFAGAYFSGMFATSLGRRLGQDFPEELFVTGILTALPRLLLAHAFPEKYAAMEKKVMAGQEELNRACVEAFGTTYTELAIEIARFWNLPKSVVSLLQGENRSDPWLAMVREASQISDMLFGNARGGAAAMKSVEVRLRKLLRDEDFHLAEFISQTCVADQNTVRFFKLTAQDVEMLVRIVEWGKVNPSEVANLLSFGAATDELNATAQENPAQIIGQILTDLTMSVRSGANVNEILLTAMEGICRCLRPGCVVVAFPDRASRQLEGRMCVGAASGVSVSEFRVSMDNDASAVVRCLNTKKALPASVARDLPSPFLQRLNLDSLLLVPIVAGGRGIGMYVIGRATPLPFSKQEETWSTALVEHVAMAFERVVAAKASFSPSSPK
jgi:HD-like signal output (HDOD) protein